MNDVMLVYGEERGSLVFLPEQVAQAIADDMDEIALLRTYGEARAMSPRVVWIPGLDEDGEHPDDAPYSVTQTPEFDNGDWPVSVATIALEELPEDLLDIGELKEPMMSVPYLHVAPSDEASVVTTVRERGYDVRRDDTLFACIGQHWGSSTWRPARSLPGVDTRPQASK